MKTIISLVASTTLIISLSTKAADQGNLPPKSSQAESGDYMHLLSTDVIPSLDKLNPREKTELLYDVAQSLSESTMQRKKTSFLKKIKNYHRKNPKKAYLFAGLTLIVIGISAHEVYGYCTDSTMWTKEFYNWIRNNFFSSSNSSTDNTRKCLLQEKPVENGRSIDLQQDSVNNRESTQAQPALSRSNPTMPCTLFQPQVGRRRAYTMANGEELINFEIPSENNLSQESVSDHDEAISEIQSQENHIEIPLVESIMIPASQIATIVHPEDALVNNQAEHIIPENQENAAQASRSTNKSSSYVAKRTRARTTNKGKPRKNLAESEFVDGKKAANKKNKKIKTKK